MIAISSAKILCSKKYNVAGKIIIFINLLCVILWEKIITYTMVWNNFNILVAKFSATFSFISLEEVLEHIYYRDWRIHIYDNFISICVSMNAEAQKEQVTYLFLNLMSRCDYNMWSKLFGKNDSPSQFLKIPRERENQVYWGTLMIITKA